MLRIPVVIESDSAEVDRHHITAATGNLCAWRDDVAFDVTAATDEVMSWHYSSLLHFIQQIVFAAECCFKASAACVYGNAVTTDSVMFGTKGNNGGPGS
jgi:hypothetical protein